MSKPLQEILQRVGKTVKRVKCAAFGRYLIVTNIATCGCVLAVGDIASQRLEHSLSNLSSKFAIDWNRNGTLITLFHVLKICHYLVTKLYHFSVGLFFIGLAFGPVNHFWYSLLDRILPQITKKTVFKKILLDQSIFGPVCVCVFVLGNSFYFRLLGFECYLTDATKCCFFQLVGFWRREPGSSTKRRFEQTFFQFIR